MLLGALLIVAAALSISFLCSLLEACVLSLSKAEVSAIAASNPRLGGIWKGFKEDLQHPLAVILVLNTCAHTLGAAFGAARFEQLYGESGVLLFSVVLSLVMIAWTEVLPKALGTRHRRTVALVAGLPLHVLIVALRPVVWLVRLLNRPFESRLEAEPPTSIEEIRALAHDATSAHVIEPHQDEIIARAAGLGHVSARKVMLPRAEISSLSTRMTLEEALVHAHLDAHTRYPLCEDGDLDRPLGYVNLKELVAVLHTNPTNATLAGIARPIRFVSPEASASEILRGFVDEHLHLAIVRDASGRTLGIITMEDLVEELVGDLEDEFDALPRMVHALGRTLFMVGGGADAREALETAGVAHPDVRGTIAALFERRLGKPPRPGDAIDVGEARLAVRRVRRGRVFEAILTAPDETSAEVCAR